MAKFYATFTQINKHNNRRQRVVLQFDKLKHRKAFLNDYPQAKAIKRAWLPTLFGQLEPFGRQYWAIKDDIPESEKIKYPGVKRVVKAKKGSNLEKIQ